MEKLNTSLPWLAVDYDRYSDYRNKFRSIEIKHRPVNTSWGEIPLTIPHPIKVHEANHRISKREHKENAEKESPLNKFLECEALLNSLDEF
jgi:hypothetical protein